MLLSVCLALFLPCAVMTLVFLVYLCLLWHAAMTTNLDDRLPVKAPPEKGLSTSELEKIPQVTGKELVMGTECAVCLDEIDGDEPARMVPGCNHGFHLECADTWLSKQPVCPICRNKLEPEVVVVVVGTEPDGLVVPEPVLELPPEPAEVEEDSPC